MREVGEMAHPSYICCGLVCGGRFYHFESSLVNTEKRCSKETLIWLVHCLMKHVKSIVLSLHFGGQY